MTSAPLVTGAIRVFAAAFLVAMMLSMGLTLGGEAPAGKTAKRRKRRLLLLALALNLVLLPLVALALTRALAASDDVAIAFLLVASAPGGRFAPTLGRMAGAELALSVEISLFLAKLVSFTAPVTARLLLHTHRIELRELPFIAQLLVLQLLPYLVGRQLRKRRPALAARLARPVAVVSWTACAIAALLIASRLRGVAALVGARGWWPVVIFAVLAPAIGWLVGGVTPATRRAVAISADARDGALALVLASAAFAAAEVQLATLAVWLFLLVTNLLLVALVRRPRRRAAAMTNMKPVTATSGGGA